MNTGAPDDLDLDKVLDNYLTQLGQNDAGAAAMAGMMPDGLAGLGGAGMGGMSGMMGMQGGMPAGLLNPAALYGGLPPNMLGMQHAAAMQTQPNMAAAAAAGGSAGGSGRPSNKKGATRGRKASEKVVSRAAAAAADDDSDAGGSSDGSASSSEQKSRKKREVSGDDDLTAAEKRHLALQEKNRRAQRRFRERQKVRFCLVLLDEVVGVYLLEGRRRGEAQLAWHEAEVTAPPAAPSQLPVLLGALATQSSCCLEHTGHQPPSLSHFCLTLLPPPPQHLNPPLMNEHLPTRPTGQDPGPAPAD